MYTMIYMYKCVYVYVMYTYLYVCKGVYPYKFVEGSSRLDVFLYYGEKAEDPSSLTEITGVFEKLDSYYSKGDEINLDWTFDSNKILKIFFNNQELISTNDQNTTHYELIDDFELN